MKILLVEDDVIIWENIKDYLQENNFMVTLVSDWKNWLKEALKNEYDLFIFDIMLPYFNWIEIIKEVKLNKIETPVLLREYRSTIMSIACLAYDLKLSIYLGHPKNFKEIIIAEMEEYTAYSKTLASELQKRGL